MVKGGRRGRRGRGEGGRRGREEREGEEGGRRGREKREGGEGGRRGREKRERRGKEKREKRERRGREKRREMMCIDVYDTRMRKRRSTCNRLRVERSECGKYTHKPHPPTYNVPPIHTHPPTHTIHTGIGIFVRSFPMQFLRKLHRLIFDRGLGGTMVRRESSVGCHFSKKLGTGPSGS